MVITHGAPNQGVGCLARRNSQLNENEFGEGSIGRISGPLAGIAEAAELSGAFTHFPDPPANADLALNNFTAGF